MTAVEFDYADILPTVRRAHSRANQDDAEEAISQAVVETLAAGKPLKASYIVTRARSRLISHFGRRESQNSSLDAAMEETPDAPPLELAIEEVDFEGAVELGRITRNPILGRRREAIEAGFAPTLKAFGGWTVDLVKEAVGAFAREEGRPPTAREFWHDPRLPSASILYRLDLNKTMACELAGIEIPEPTRWTRDVLLDRYAEFYDRHGRWPKWRERRNSHGLAGAKVTLLLLGTTAIAEIIPMVEAHRG